MAKNFTGRQPSMDQVASFQCALLHGLARIVGHVLKTQRNEHVHLTECYSRGVLVLPSIVAAEDCVDVARTCPHFFPGFLVRVCAVPELNFGKMIPMPETHLIVIFLPGCPGLASRRRSESACPTFGKVRRPKTDAALLFSTPNPSRKFMPRIASCVNRLGTRESYIQKFRGRSVFLFVESAHR